MTHVANMFTHRVVYLTTDAMPSIAEKVEPLIGIHLAAVIILAVDNLRLLRMECQSTFSEPLFERYAQCCGLCLTGAMTNRIVGIALERDGGMIPRHPDVEGIMQEKVRQDRADRPPFAAFLSP
jgi:hypothetical protein